MPVEYELPQLSTKGDEAVTLEAARKLLATLQLSVKRFVDDIDPYVQETRVRQERVGSRGRFLLHAVRSAASPPTSPLLASMSALTFGISGSSSLERALKGSSVEIKKCSKPKKTKSKSVTSPKTKNASPTSEAKPADEPANDDDEGYVDEKVKIIIYNDAEALRELTQLEIFATEISKRLEDVSAWFEFRTMFLGDGQAKELLGTLAETVGEVSDLADGFTDVKEEFVRAKADLEKTLIKHPDSKEALRLLQLHSVEIFDTIEDAYNDLRFALVQLKFTFTKDLPVVAQVLSMEGDLGASEPSEGMESGGMYM